MRFKKTIAVFNTVWYNKYMQYLKDSLKYIYVNGAGKRFSCLFFISLFPATALAFAFPIDRLILNIYFPPQYSDWASVWLSYFNGIKSFISLLIGIVASTISTTVICGALIRHFRIGNFSTGKIIRSFNDYFFAAILYTLTLLVVFTFSLTVYTVFQYMWYTTLNPIAYKVVSTITLLIILLGLCFLLGSITLWLPSMCIKGIYKKSMGQAFYQSRTKQKKFFPGILFVAIVLLVTTIISALVTKVWYISLIINAIGYAIAFSFFIVHMMITYFGENKLPREDLYSNPYNK